MAFEYLSNVALEEAVSEFLRALEARGMAPRTESVPVAEALGRVTAEPLYAAISAPHYHACAMDGIALAASVTFGASATTPVVVAPEDYVVVDTGDPMPAGCDAVVMIEDVVYAEGDSAADLGKCPVTLYTAVAPWGNVRQIGEDICAGEMLLTSNVRIEPAAMGAMLAAGVQEVSVIARPRVGIIPTGDEVVAPSANPRPGDVMEFNSTIFSGMVRQWGGEPVVFPIVKDKPELVRDALQEAVACCDVVLLNAGSSAGRDDYSSRAVKEIGELLYHGIAIKPGKPAILGCAGGQGAGSAELGGPGTLGGQGACSAEPGGQGTAGGQGAGSAEAGGADAVGRQVAGSAESAVAGIAGGQGAGSAKASDTGAVGGQVAGSVESGGSATAGGQGAGSAEPGGPGTAGGQGAGSAESAVAGISGRQGAGSAGSAVAAGAGGQGAANAQASAAASESVTAIIGVPGYPVSGIIVVEALLKPLIERLYGCAATHDRIIEATLTRPCTSSLKYQEFVRVRLGCVGDKTVATPLSRGAGVVTSFVKADGIMRVPQNSEGFEAGEKVNVRLLRPFDEIERSLVVIGSHDPLIDEVAQLMHARWPEMSVASTHVGSMGAIVAAKRGENHCGGIHLLDETTGEYNTAYLEKHFPKGGVRQVECVYRSQGLMVAPGNPLGIESLADLAQPGRSYVNRQKGSGTRILADYVCKRDGIDTSAIYGYDHEEFTHTAVAALIEAGSADAGMGIYSAAKMYGLGFVPVCEEQYDLLIPDYAWDTPMVQALLETLRSDAFRKRMEQLGGYRVDAPGRVR